MHGHGYALLIRGVTTVTAGTGEQAAPTSGETKTLWASNLSVNSSFSGPRWKRLICGIFSSHASAASGLQFDESNDGTTWRNLVSYSVSATIYTKSIVAVSAPYVRVVYVNSANTLTTWEMSILGDHDERGNT